MDNTLKIAALIVAAGRGARMGKDAPKQYALIGGRSVLARTIEAFQNHPDITTITVVIHEDDEKHYNQSLTELSSHRKLTQFVVGGDTRQASVLNGLHSLTANAPSKVLIHDAARPLVSQKTISSVVGHINENTAVMAAIPVADTLRRDKETIDRQDVWRAQTPQGFTFSDILNAHQKTTDRTYTDDIAVAQAAGINTTLFIEGNPENIKLTYPEDMHMAEKLIAPQMEYRTGQGFDVHGFEEGNAVTLCGVSMPHSQKLKGHSDADVGMHALTDAILGAIAEGDIGDHFPPSDPQWKGVASDIFLAKAVELTKTKGGKITHCDITLICEAPKIGPHRDKMRQRLADILSIEVGRISVKATTTEKLGFTGRGEGISALATATIGLPI